MRKKYGADSVSAFFYASIEIEAWGGETIFVEDGPPNSGEPFIKKPEDIPGLKAPKVSDSPGLQMVLDATRKIKENVGDTSLIIGVVISPFSAPVMQMGFDKYIELMYEHPETLEYLLKLNESFCTEWANAQIAAGATAICYFDPVSSPTIVTRDLYLKYGFPSAKRTLASFNGPAVIHFASGICLPIANDITQTGEVAIGVSASEDLKDLKNAFRGKLTLIGNLNAIEMRHWSSSQTESMVKDAIAKAGPGGGFVLADNHGEIPWQVPEEVLMTISETVHRWGEYPLKWTNN